MRILKVWQYDLRRTAWLLISLSFLELATIVTIALLYAYGDVHSPLWPVLALSFCVVAVAYPHARLLRLFIPRSTGNEWQDFNMRCMLWVLAIGNPIFLGWLIGAAILALKFYYNQGSSGGGQKPRRHLYLVRSEEDHRPSGLKFQSLSFVGS